MPPRKRAQAMAQGRGRDAQLVVPLAFDVAALVSARPLGAFRTEPTQLANGLLELFRATGADGICCCLAGGLEWEGVDTLDPDRVAEGARVAASLEATRRLRSTVGDDAALVAGLTGPRALAHHLGGSVERSGEVVVALARRFCEAGTDVVLLFEDAGRADDDDEIWTEALKTVFNVVRFHRGLTFLMGADGPLPKPATVDLADRAVGPAGLVTTPGVVAADSGIALLIDWVKAVRAKE